MLKAGCEKHTARGFVTDRFILPQSAQRMVMPKELGRYSQDQDYLDHSDVLRFLKKYALTIGVCSAAGAGLAVGTVITTPPTFTARAQILIDPAAAQAIRDKTGAPESGGFDPAKVEGQIAVLRSETIAQSVIAKLDLTNSPDFKGDAPSLFGRMSNAARRFLLGGPDESSENLAEAEFIRTRVAVAQFQNNLDIRRVGLSYALDIAYTSRNPDAAASIANAVADVYVQDQIKTMSEAARQSSVWLEQRIDELRKQLNDSAREVQLFRSGQNSPAADPRSFIPPQNPGPADGKPQVPTFGTNSSAPLSNPQAWVTLAELESKAQNYRKVYETYLQAFTETVQKQSFQVASARVITAATRPLTKGQPKSKLIFILGVIIGSLVGFGVAFIRHAMDNTVHSARQVRDNLGLNCLAMVPRLINTGSNFLSKGQDLLSTEYTFREVAAAPFSPFSGALKMVRTAIVNASNKTPVRVIGITSALPGEGKTTISGNLALLFALGKSRVLLVDVDIHHSTISHTFAPNVKVGLIEVLNGDVALSKTIVSGKGRGPDILPLVTSGSSAFPYELLSSDKMRETLITLKQTYDYIILDMPPLRPIVDGLAISSLLDGIILVAEWAETPLNLLEDVVGGLHTAQAEILGVVLSKVAPSAVNIPHKKQVNYSYQPQQQ